MSVRIPVGVGLFFLFSSIGAGQSVSEQSWEGFTEPYRTIRIAADEMGVIAELHVSEGDEVEAGHPLLRLNSDVQESVLAIAAQNMRATGRLQVALAEAQHRQQRCDRLKLLREEGHARAEELEKSILDLSVAQAQIKAAEEDVQARQLEYQRFKVQLERRSIRAPISGVISSIHKQPGEIVAANDPHVMTLVELHPLIVRFTTSSRFADKQVVGQSLSVRFAESSSLVNGTIEFIAPTTDAESGTVQIKVRLENQDGKLRSGERCSWVLGSGS
jgi:RND family efflux transporter MFP subunit